MFDIQAQPGTDITQALNSALAQHRDVRVVLDGAAFVSTVQGVDGMHLCGLGPQTVLVRNTQVGGAALLAKGKTGIRVSDLSIDIAASADYRGGIDCQDSSDIDIARCRIFSSTVPQVPSPTLYAVVAKRCSGLWVHCCEIENAQIKVNGGSEDVTISRNTITNGLNYGIAALTRVASDKTQGVRIVENTVINAYAGGIYCGVDGDTGHGEMHDVLISGNVVKTGPYAQGFGILFRAGEAASGIVIAGNNVEPLDPLHPHSSACRVKPIDTGGVVVRLVIEGNRFVGSDLADLDVTIQQTKCTIADNHLEGGRGLKVLGRMGGVSDVLVSRVTSLPRGTFKSITLTANAATLRAVNAWPGSQPGGVQQVQQQGGIVALTTTQ